MSYREDDMSDTQQIMTDRQRAIESARMEAGLQARDRLHEAIIHAGPLLAADRYSAEAVRAFHAVFEAAKDLDAKAQIAMSPLPG